MNQIKTLDKINQIIELLLDLDEFDIKSLSSRDLYRLESVIRISTLAVEHEVFMRTTNNRSEKLIYTHKQEAEF